MVALWKGTGTVHGGEKQRATGKDLDEKGSHLAKCYKNTGREGHEGRDVLLRR